MMFLLENKWVRDKKVWGKDTMEMDELCAHFHFSGSNTEKRRPLKIHHSIIILNMILERF